MKMEDNLSKYFNSDQRLVPVLEFIRDHFGDLTCGKISYSQQSRFLISLVRELEIGNQLLVRDLTACIPIGLNIMGAIFCSQRSADIKIDLAQSHAIRIEEIRKMKAKTDSGKFDQWMENYFTPVIQDAEPGRTEKLFFKMRITLEDPITDEIGKDTVIPELKAEIKDAIRKRDLCTAIPLIAWESLPQYRESFHARDEGFQLVGHPALRQSDVLLLRKLWMGLCKKYPADQRFVIA